MSDDEEVAPKKNKKKGHWGERNDPACGTPYEVECATDYNAVICKRCLNTRKNFFDPWEILFDAGRWLGEGLVGLLGEESGEEATSKPKKKKPRKKPKKKKK